MGLLQFYVLKKKSPIFRLIFRPGIDPHLFTPSKHYLSSGVRVPDGGPRSGDPVPPGELEPAAGLLPPLHYPLRRRRQLRQADRGLPGKQPETQSQVTKPKWLGDRRGTKGMENTDMLNGNS